MTGLAAAARAAAVIRLRGRRLPRPPRILYPKLIEQVYLRDILRGLAPAKKLVDERVLPQIEAIVQQAARPRVDGTRADDDDYSDRIERVFDGVTVEYAQLVPESSIRTKATQAALDASKFNGTQVERQVKTVLGFDVVRSEPWLRAEAKAFTAENVKLIKSIPERYFDEVEKLVMRGARSGRRAEDIQEDIRARYDVSESRAALIARDQIGKWNGDLTRRRHEDLGLRRYRWRTCMDERVRGRPDGKYPDARPSHWDREGKIYSYDNPPEGGNPGEAILDRCWAEPVFEDLLGEEYAVDLTPAPAASATSTLARARPAAPISTPEPLQVRGAIKSDMSLAKAEDTIRAKKVEHLGVFGERGELLYSDVGGKRSVPVPGSAIDMMRDNGNAVLTHNHPAGSPFSAEDICLAIKCNLKEMRAALPDGSAWSLRRPVEGWRSDTNERELVSGLRKAYNDGLEASLRRFKDLLAEHGSVGVDVEATFHKLRDEEVARAYHEYATANGHGWRIKRER